MDEQQNALLEGINALKSCQEEMKKIISEANGWTEEVKAFPLAASIRVETAEILQTLPDTVRLNLNSYIILGCSVRPEILQGILTSADENKTPENRRQLAGVCLRIRKARQLGFLRPPSYYVRNDLSTIFRGQLERGGNPEDCKNVRCPRS
ncbi:hypothetical protein TNCV_5074901 [Trichonephila clavipes]|nr:hypothetical protein TNCV_5074901 [Trichonephila clavipes]